MQQVENGSLRLLLRYEYTYTSQLVLEARLILRSQHREQAVNNSSEFHTNDWKLVFLAGDHLLAVID